MNSLVTRIVIPWLPYTKYMLTTIFVDDFSSWEKEYLLPFAKAMSERLGAKFYIANSYAALKESSVSESVWVIAHDFRRAGHAISRVSGKGSLYLSVFQCVIQSGSALNAFWRQVFRSIPRQARLITHHPMTLRYLKEFDQVSPERLFDLPLPFPDFLELPDHAKQTSGVVGTLSHLDADSNLHFLALLAHRMLKKNSAIRFRVLGDGPLRNHLMEMASHLNLGDRFDVSPISRLSEITQWDAFLFAPLRCDHLIAPLIGFASQVPTVCMETPGLEEWLDGLAVPLVPIYETEKMARSIEDVLGNAAIRAHYRLTLTQGLNDRLSIAKVAVLYGRTFGINDFSVSHREVA